MGTGQEIVGIGRFWVWALESSRSRVRASGFWPQGSGFRVQALGLGLCGSAFRVRTLGFGL